MSDYPIDNKETDVLIDEQTIDRQISSHPRSATLLNLKWLAQRLRRSESIKQKMRDGQYKIDSESIARAMLD